MKDTALPGRERLWGTAGNLLQLVGKEINILELIGHVARSDGLMKTSYFRGVALKGV